MCLEKNAAMTMTCSIACLRELFLAFSGGWRGTATHAGSAARSPSGATGMGPRGSPAAMKGARARNGNAPGRGEKKGDTAAKRRACSRSRFVASFLYYTSAPARRFVGAGRETATTGRCCYSNMTVVSSDPCLVASIPRR